MTRLILLLSFLANVTVLNAQDYTQVVRGRVVDATTQAGLIGATVQLGETELATTTDDGGHYRFENVPVGRYQLVINYLGYEKIRILELLVETGKEVVRNVELQPTSAELTEVVVRAERERVIHPVSTRTITVEETRRFPATFFDPARLAASYAGVVNANDQANALIIRGNSPASNNWQIAGAEIVNPNHTPNAGTFSDRPTFTGGGVNILSAQMLDNSTLLTGAFPVQYGNALGGILDMNFR
ncbi:MAG: carboxypeptidase-like regulatory domain-containing protein, partial [Saprospiraceae bacterium]